MDSRRTPISPITIQPLGSSKRRADLLISKRPALPKYWVTKRQQERQEEITNGFPDSLDLMLVCVEAGQSLDQAIQRVSKEIRAGYPSLADEYEIVGHEKLHLWYRTHAPKVEQERIPIDQRETSFDEVLRNLTEDDALFEARRCLSCGNCFECDGCYGACPQGAVIKLGPGKRYEFDFDKCTGCAVCYEQCPCHAIEMIDEPEVGTA